MKNFDELLKWQAAIKPDCDFFEYGDPKEFISEMPGVYRWRFENPIGTIKQVYLGESQNLRKRIKSYKSVGRPWLRNEFRDWPKGKIFLDILKIQDFEFNYKSYSARSLYFERTRKLFENIMLYQELGQGYKILNKGYE